MRRSILKDTVLLTLMQMLLDGLALGVNVLLNAKLGAEGIGVLTLAASFFRLACMIAGGNAFLCVSRFVSEELGKPLRHPAGILRHCIFVSMTLSCVTMLLICLFAEPLREKFLHDPSLRAPIRHMAYVVVGIREIYRGQGIGTEFFRRLDNWAKEKGIVRLDLTVECPNTKAKNLYEKNGFQVEGIRSKSMKVAGRLTDEYYMAKICG